LKDQALNGRIILKWILQKWNERKWSGMIRICTGKVFCPLFGIGNEYLLGIKCGKFLY
jgi:hypothetical protein